MVLLDLIITVLLGYQSFQGWQKGFVRLFFELLALILGLVEAMKNYRYVATLINQQWAWPVPVTNVVAFVAIWGVIFMGLSLVAWGLDRLINLTVLAVFKYCLCLIVINL